MLEISDFNFKNEDYRYVGGFIGSRTKLLEWLEPKIQEWVEGIKILSKAAKKYPQTDYCGLASTFPTN